MDINRSSEALEKLRNSLRDGQKMMGDWQGGKMAISAVPGAGKSHSLSVAAALAIARYQLHPRRQLVIVTYTRSAAASIKKKVRDRLQTLQLPANGFIVHTLHGLAYSIASRHPELSGLDLDTATLITPNTSHQIIKDTVRQWINHTPDRYNLLLEGRAFDGEETERLRRESVLRTEVLPSLTHTVIREAKSSGLSPEKVWQLSEHSNDHYQILAIAAGLYREYEKLMRSRNLIDYDDMILAALQVLENPAISLLWQNQVFAVFEDEAQDSSPLQEKLISLLALDPLTDGTAPNLVRVGDPNQAINSTFTPADPAYFNWFCDACQQQERLATMDQAGRSNQIIIDAANFTLEWVNNHWNQNRHTSAPELASHDESKPFRLQAIRPVPKGDPQPDANPKPVGKGLEIHIPEDIHHTVSLIQQRVLQLLQDNPDKSAAILVRENRQGHFLYQKLTYLQREHQIKVYEVSEAERQSHIPREILTLLQFIDRPHSPDYLKAALEVLQVRQLIPAQDLNALATYPEVFLYPTPLESPQKSAVEKARRYCCNLLQARLDLPHYHLIAFLGMTLKYTGSELATLHKLSERVNQQIKGRSSLPSSIGVLQEIVSSENFEAVTEESEDKYTKPGQLTIITMHKAKGLDWDYVFIPFLHEDILPGKPWIPVAAQFLGDFTLAEVARAQIRAAVHSQYLNGDRPLVIPQPLTAWEEAGRLKQAEEFRLLYVAMTRAKRILWLSAAQRGPFRWSTLPGEGDNNLVDKKPCPVLTALQHKFAEAITTL